LHQLVGLGGRFGWRHPGPLWIQLLVPGYELSGHAPWALSVGVLAVHIACIVVAVLVVGRSAPVMAAAVCIYIEAVGLVYWTNLWAGYAFTWPVLALVALGAVAASRPEADWALAGAFLTGTLLVQTDVSTAVPVVAIGAAAIILRARRRALARPPSDAALVLLVLTVIAWIPPLVQRHNIGLLWNYATHSSGHYSLRTAVAATGAALSVVPLGARWVLVSGVQQHLGRGPLWAIAWTVGFALVNGLTAARAYTASKRLAGDLAVLALVGTAAAVFAMTRVEGPINFYLLTWISILPVPTIVAVVTTFAPVSRITDYAALGVAVVLAGVLVVTQGTTHNWDKVASADAMQMTERVGVFAGAAARGLVAVHVVSSDTWPQAAGVALQLERAGAHIEVDQRWVFLFGDAFKPVGAPPTLELWFARPHERPDVSELSNLVDLGVVDNVDVWALSR
jgi:hypothetical protein